MSSPLRGTPVRRPQAADADLPAAFHATALSALDDFEAIATEYTLILDTQRALFASGNVDGAIETLARGDAIARQAGRCGRRLAPAREALANNQYRGPRATELSRRLAAVGVRADVLGANAMQLAAACTVKRDGISTELSSAATASPAVGRGTIGYLSSVRTPMALDVTR